jgi:drug/metabolite transporter (DMT)-like permease
MPSRALVAFVALGVIWGSNFIFMKWSSAALTPGQIAVSRVLFGFAPLLAFAAARGDMRLAHARHWYHFAAMSLLATSLYYWAFAAGTALLPSGIAGALSGAIPLFAFAGAVVLLRGEAVTRRAARGLAVGLLGVLLVARPWDAEGSVDPIGVAFMLLGSASVGLSFVYARRFLTPLGIPPSALTTYQMGFALLTLAVVVDLTGATEVAGDPRALVALVLGLGVLGTGVAYLLYYVVVDRMGAVPASSATYIPPVVALAIGWALVGEPITLLDAAAVALILAGVVLIRRRPEP